MIGRGGCTTLDSERYSRPGFHHVRTLLVAPDTLSRLIGVPVGCDKGLQGGLGGSPLAVAPSWRDMFPEETRSEKSSKSVLLRNLLGDSDVKCFTGVAGSDGGSDGASVASVVIT